VVASAAGALIGSSGKGRRWMLLIPALAAVAIAYTLWVNVYPPQPGAYRVIPWIVLAWCCVPLIATLVHPRLVELVTSGFLAARVRAASD
jgi:predicted membrane channel-forming protein YqfA (hemolysin III family)